MADENKKIDFKEIEKHFKEGKRINAKQSSILFKAIGKGYEGIENEYGDPDPDKLKDKKGQDAFYRSLMDPIVDETKKRGYTGSMNGLSQIYKDHISSGVVGQDSADIEDKIQENGEDIESTINHILTNENYRNHQAGIFQKALLSKDLTLYSLLFLQGVLGFLLEIR